MPYDPNRPDYPSNNVGQDVDQIRENTNQLRAHERGPVMPNNPVAGMIWADDSGAELALKLRNKANSGFIRLHFPAGTKMVFFQASAPFDWTQDITQNDKALRVVSGVGGGSGGTRVMSSINIGDTILNIAQIPAHTHGSAGAHSHTLKVTAGSGEETIISEIGQAVGAWSPSYISNSPTHTHNSEGGGAAHNHDLSLAYIDVIICTKD